MLSQLLHAPRTALIRVTHGIMGILLQAVVVAPRTIITIITITTIITIITIITVGTASGLLPGDRIAANKQQSLI